MHNGDFHASQSGYAYLEVQNNRTWILLDQDYFEKIEVAKFFNTN